jgi:hypothetical protein
MKLINPFVGFSIRRLFFTVYAQLSVRELMSSDDEKLSIVFWVVATLDMVESILNCYQTTQHEILHRMIHKVLKS